MFQNYPSSIDELTIKWNVTDLLVKQPTDEELFLKQQ